MTDTRNTAPVAALKAQARRLRERLNTEGVEISHGKALEMIAHQHGARDWNTLRASAGNRLLFNVGDRVSGSYLGQPFSAQVRAVSMLGDGALRRVTLHFDDPVDVVRFDSFSAYRQRVSGTVGWDGRSAARTSDGAPQLAIHEVL